MFLFLMFIILTLLFGLGAVIKGIFAFFLLAVLFGFVACYHGYRSLK